MLLFLFFKKIVMWNYNTQQASKNMQQSCIRPVNLLYLTFSILFDMKFFQTKTSSNRNQALKICNRFDFFFLHPASVPFFQISECQLVYAVKVTKKISLNSRYTILTKLLIKKLIKTLII